MCVQGVCGYPECDATVPEERSEGRYLLDSKAGKVLQMTKEASMVSSRRPVWLMGPRQRFSS